MDLINFKEYPVKNVLDALLKDKTTKKNIIFATDAYSEYNVDSKTEMTSDFILGLDSFVIQPRVFKSLEEQSQRTRKKAEVFTPSWVCNRMNNHCDAEWFGREGVFNREDGQTWTVNPEKVQFDKPDDWQKYVDSNRIEITCGEAPYLVSRYDTTTGDTISVPERIGILDRKLRVVYENTDNEEEWLKWTCRAFQSVYGYEFQGDNLIIARVNLLMTFVDYMRERWGRVPDDDELKKIANVITWNLWQMDGITGTIPFKKPKEKYPQMTFFDFEQGINDTENEEVDCRIFDWRSKKSITYRSIKEQRR
ncbi:MAG: hypothetical protein II893_00075 [Methanomicrobium sp.]|nr:hypothetical protein [Methanomicrobium sp.]